MDKGCSVNRQACAQELVIIEESLLQEDLVTDLAPIFLEKLIILSITRANKPSFNLSISSMLQTIR